MRINNLDWKKWSFGLTILTVVTTFLIIQAKAAETSDAIAVRIMPNLNHYSIETWYQQQGYKGSPQKLTVDGYEAVRDGRTVFVNAANVDNNKIYTNIYLISYNQDPNIKTVDILGQLVSHWKFNSNLSTIGQCSISKIVCSADMACPTDYVCSTGSVISGSSFNSSNKGKCLPKIEQKCLVDSDCPVNLFCDSAKAKVTRDVKRLGQLGDIKEALKVIDTQNSRFPELAGGTYVPGNTISTWPSWQETFWPKLSGLALMTDPINVLGDCPGFEAATCWKKVENQFYQTSNGKLILPEGSYTYLYSAEQNGINYNLCATFETNGLYETADNQLSKDACAITAISTNTPPKISDSFLTGESGLEFTGYIKAEDDQGDTISWRLDTGSTNFATWSDKPVLKDSGTTNQKIIYATMAGSTGSYPITLILTDSRGLEARYPLTIIITANKPIIEADNIDYLVNPILPLNYTFSVYSTKGLNPDQITITKRDSGTLNLFGFPNATEVKTEVGLNHFRIDKSVFIPTGTPLPEDSVVTYRIIATDKKGNVAQKDININLKADKPYLNFDCDTNARVGQPYPINNVPCLIGPLSQGNHSINYSLTAYSGLSLRTSEDGKSYLSGIAPASASAGTQVVVTATNEYGASSAKSFLIKVNNYCGDGKLQTPNSEGKGGISNDGVESCDGTEGITTTVSTSSALQYGCTTNNADNYPILNNQSCVFKDGNSGGGYCGDGLCQFKVNNIDIENTCNCAVDCGSPTSGDGCNPITSFCGDGVIDPGEECDGANLGGRICDSYLLNPNGISCTSDCKFNTQECEIYNFSSVPHDPCKPGTFQITWWNTLCSICPAGTFAAGFGNINCTHCPTNYYSLPGAASCSPVTTICSDGFYASGTSCLPCTAGYYCFGGYGRAACPFGYTGPVGNKSKEGCTICPENTYSYAGDASCTPCQPYFFNTPNYYHPESWVGFFSSPGSSECTMIACEPGYYSTGTTCAVCPAGKYCTGCNLHYVGVNCSANYTSSCPTDFTSLPGSKVEGDCFLNCPPGTLPMLGSNKISDCYADPGW